MHFSWTVPEPVSIATRSPFPNRTRHRAQLPGYLAGNALDSRGRPGLTPEPDP
jgi:hypothetical protein